MTYYIDPNAESSVTTAPPGKRYMTIRDRLALAAIMALGNDPLALERRLPDYCADVPNYGPPPESKAAARESKRARRQAAWDRARGVKP